jgi:hypothetical protein
LAKLIHRYGIGSFVYSSRRPFHPHRLWELVSKPFAVLQPGVEEEEEDDEDEIEIDDEDWKANGDVEMKSDEEEEEEEEETPEEALARMKAEKEAMNLPARAEFKKASPVWKGVLRSKGFCWLATRPCVHGEWSQAGVNLHSGREVKLIFRSCLLLEAVDLGCVPYQRLNGQRTIRKSSKLSRLTLWVPGVIVSLDSLDLNRKHADLAGRQERKLTICSGPLEKLTISRLYRSRHRPRFDQVYSGCRHPQRQRMGSMGEGTPSLL